MKAHGQRRWPQRIAVVTLIVAGGVGAAWTGQWTAGLAQDTQTQEQKRVYVWEANPYSFLVRALETVGFERKEALETAEAVMAQTNLAALSEPDALLRYAFSAAGFESDRAEHAAKHTVKQLSANIGELRPASVALRMPARRPEPGVSTKIPYNKRPFFSGTQTCFPRWLRRCDASESRGRRRMIGRSRH